MAALATAVWVFSFILLSVVIVATIVMPSYWISDRFDRGGYVTKLGVALAILWLFIAASLWVGIIVEYV